MVRSCTYMPQILVSIWQTGHFIWVCRKKRKQRQYDDCIEHLLLDEDLLFDDWPVIVLELITPEHLAEQLQRTSRFLWIRRIVSHMIDACSSNRPRFPKTWMCFWQYEANLGTSWIVGLWDIILEIACYKMRITMKFSYWYRICTLPNFWKKLNTYVNILQNLFKKN